MKFRISSLLLITILLIMLNACATVPLAQPEADIQIKNMPPPSDKALLYVYRDNLFAGSAVIYNIYINERRIDGRLAVNTFLAVALEPGEYRFSNVPSHLEAAALPSFLAANYLPINLSAGNKYYIKISAARDAKLFASAPEAFNDAKLIHNYGQPATIAAAKSKGREVSPPIIERKPIAKSDIDVLPSTRLKTNGNSYAVVIGIEEYRETLPNAEYAANDARLVAEYLTKSLGVPEENLIILTNSKATKSDMEKYFHKWLLNNVTKESDVFIYFSGHGAPDHSGGDAYLVPFDGDPTYIAETGYPLHRLYEVLNKLPSKRNVVILDSCFSGAGNRSVIAKGLRPLVVMAANQEIVGTNTTVLSASTGNQVSSTYMEKGHGLLTYFILKGIKEEPIRNHDGYIDMEILYPYVKQNVERIARKQYNNEQTPQLWRGKQRFGEGK